PPPCGAPPIFEYWRAAARPFNGLRLLKREVPLPGCCRTRQRLLVGRRSLLARPRAGVGVVFECGAVGGRDRSLGRQRAGRRAAGDALGTDKGGHRRLIFVVIHDLGSFPACGLGASPEVVNEVIVRTRLCREIKNLPFYC